MDALYCPCFHPYPDLYALPQWQPMAVVLGVFVAALVVAFVGGNSNGKES